MTDLPHGWRLEAIADLTGLDGLMTDGDWVESKDQDPNGTVRLIQLADIGDGTFLSRSSRFLTEAKARELQCTFLNDGDLLIARMPDPLGRACIFPGVGQKAVTAVDVCIWRKGKGGAEARWLKYAINSPQVREAIELLAGGTTRQRISGGNLKRLKVPTPPLAEQSRIASKLDILVTKSRNAREELGRIPRLAERHKQAVLAAAFLEAQRQAKVSSCFGDITAEVRNGLSRKPNQSPPGIPILRISAVRPGRVNVADHRFYVTETAEDITAFQLRNGDLLFTRYNGNPELVAVCGVVRELTETLLYPDKLIRVRLQDNVIAPFVEILMASPQMRARLSPFIKTAAGQHGISGRDLKSVSMPLPAISIQEAIVAHVIDQLKEMSAVDLESARAMSLLDRLERSILQKAYTGKLLPQNPDDYPFSTVSAANGSGGRGRATESKARQRTSIANRPPRMPKEKAAVTKSRQDEDVKGKSYLADILKSIGKSATAEELFRRAHLPLTDFYKQLAWEVDAGYIKDGDKRLDVA